MAEALGWPDKELGWVDLHDLADSEAGWGSVGHPSGASSAWARPTPTTPRPGSTPPSAPTSRARVWPPTSPSTTSTPARPAFVSAVERSIVHYGDITMTFLANLRRADAEGQGLTYVPRWRWRRCRWCTTTRATPAATGNRGRRRTAERAARAVYPKEGTLMSDHPYVVLTEADEPNTPLRRLSWTTSSATRRSRCSWTTRSGARRAHRGPVDRGERVLPAERGRALPAVGERAQRDAGELG